MQVPNQRTNSRLDRAYGCYAFIGLATFIMGTISLLQDIGKINFNTGEGLGMMFGLPLALGMLFAFVYGIVLTIQLWRHPPLIILCGLSIVVLAGSFAALSFETEDSDYNILGGFAKSAKDCPRGWAFKENLFIKRDGSKLPGCVNLENIQQIGELRTYSLESDAILDPVMEATLCPAKKPQPPRPNKNHPPLSGELLGGFYVAANIFIPSWWFIRGRRRYRDKLLGAA